MRHALVASAVLMSLWIGACGSSESYELSQESSNLAAPSREADREALRGEIDLAQASGRIFVNHDEWTFLIYDSNTKTFIEKISGAGSPAAAPDVS